MTNTALAISRLTKLAPSRVSHTASGGFAAAFRNGIRYGDIEILPTGEMVAVVSDGAGNVDTWDVTSDAIEEAVRRIREYIAL